MAILTEYHIELNNKNKILKKNVNNAKKKCTKQDNSISKKINDITKNITGLNTKKMPKSSNFLQTELCLAHLEHHES